jgi:hypothetical protein
MFTLWRKLVVWLRTFLLKISKKEKVEWGKSISELLTIIAGLLTKQEDGVIPQPVEPVKPTKPTVPDYNIIPKPTRKRLLDWLLRR